MMMHKTASYVTKKQILMFPNHYVAFAQTFVQNDPLAEATPEGRNIVLAGTIFPANDDTARGVVLNDLDVTDGDKSGAVVVHGFIHVEKLPAAPSGDAKAALKQITFFEEI